MRLRGIEFGPVWDASGVRGFFGEGYWYHRLIPGLSFKGSTFVAKTTTLGPRKGHMPLRKDFTPAERKPKCIAVKARQGAVLNAVGLSGPGAEALLLDGRWQERTEPFFLSFMPVGETPQQRFSELNVFVRLLDKFRIEFQAPFGLQINVSCPNTGHAFGDIETETRMLLTRAATLRIPLVPKFSAITPVDIVARIARHPDCDAVCVSNTVPWGQVDPIMRHAFSGSLTSPLAEYGGGGLSGAPIFPIVVDWVKRAVASGFPKPINAGGGILGPRDVQTLKNAGAASVFLGSIAVVRGWRVRKTIRAAHHCFGKED